MPRGPKRAKPTPKPYRHRRAKRANNPTAESVRASSSRRKAPARHPLDIREESLPQIPYLAWQRKAFGDGKEWASAPPLQIQEKIDPHAWISGIRRRALLGKEGTLFANYEGLEDPEAAKVEWYQHQGEWRNRLIHAESRRAMASLLKHESMAGSVQCIYFDPPYGMDFDATMDGTSAMQATAFRDTYRNGIHSYLDLIRETLMLARELLTESGSLFMQIGDVNVNRCALVLDEVFGPENRMQMISYQASQGGPSTKSLPKDSDYILWYAKDRKETRFQQLYRDNDIRSWIESNSFAGGGGIFLTKPVEPSPSKKGKIPNQFPKEQSYGVCTHY